VRRYRSLSAKRMVLFSQRHNQRLSPVADDGSEEHYSKNAVMINLHYRSVIYRSMSRPSYTRFLNFFYYFESQKQMDRRRIENFILFYTPGEKWPAHYQSDYWTSASNLYSKEWEQMQFTEVIHITCKLYTFFDLLSIQLIMPVTAK